MQLYSQCLTLVGVIRRRYGNDVLSVDSVALHLNFLKPAGNVSKMDDIGEAETGTREAAQARFATCHPL